MVSNGFCWYAIHTKPKQEDRADSNLRALKIETFVPKLRKCKYNSYTQEPIYKIGPLFPRYIFACFDAIEMLHTVRFTRGVHRVVSFGDRPTPIDYEIITIMKSRTGEDSVVRIGDAFKPGDRLMIKGGPLMGFIGMFEQELKDTDRVMILLTTVRYTPRLVVEREVLKKLAPLGV